MRSTSALFFLACAYSFGQTSTSTRFSGTAQIGEPDIRSERLIIGAPYSGEQVSENVMTLADGTHITRKTRPIKVFRDSAGRTRRERFLNPLMPMPGFNDNGPLIIEIVDPLTQSIYTLDTVNHVAYRQHTNATARSSDATNRAQSQLNT